MTIDFTCPLCGSEETKYHFLRCSNQQLGSLREAHWKKLIYDINQQTANGCRQVFQVGLETTIGQLPPTIDTKQEWPVELQEAYESQERIDWDQVLLGRLAKEWKSLADIRQDRHDGRLQSRWKKQIIRQCWTYGMDLWKARNSLVHGTDGAPSVTERQHTELLV